MERLPQGRFTHASSPCLLETCWTGYGPLQTNLGRNFTVLQDGSHLLRRLCWKEITLKDPLKSFKATRYISKSCFWYTLGMQESFAQSRKHFWMFEGTICTGAPSSFSGDEWKKIFFGFLDWKHRWLFKWWSLGGWKATYCHDISVYLYCQHSERKRSLMRQTGSVSSLGISGLWLRRYRCAYESQWKSFWEHWAWPSITNSHLCY